MPPRRFLLAAAVAVAATALAALPVSAVPGYKSVRCDPDCNVLVTSALGPANEVALAVNPANPANIVAVAKDYSLGQPSPCGAHRVWAGIYRSMDGGRTWSNQLLLLDELAGLYGCISDPVIVFAADGTAYFVGLALRPTEVFVARSDDGGATWQHVSRVVGGGDKQWAAVDPLTGRLWVTWVGGATIGLARSDDRGETWERVRFGAAGTLIAGQGPMLAIGPPVGSEPSPVYLAWRELSTGTIFVATSLDDGATWAVVPAAVAAGAGDRALNARQYRYISLPTMAVDRSSTADRGTVWLAYADLSQSRAEIRVVHTHNQGQTWGIPQTLGGSTGTLVTDDFMPSLSVGPDGHVHVFYYSTAYDPAGALGTLLDVQYVHGRAELWDRPVRVTTVSTDSQYSHHQSGDRFIGDYIGAAAGPDVAYAAWADTRNGRADVYFAAVPR